MVSVLHKELEYKVENRLSYIIPEFFFLENLGNFREKIEKFENFRHFEHSPDFWQHFTGKTLAKCFLFYSYRQREGSVQWGGMKDELPVGG